MSYKFFREAKKILDAFEKLLPVDPTRAISDLKAALKNQRNIVERSVIAKIKQKYPEVAL